MVNDKGVPPLLPGKPPSFILLILGTKSDFFSKLQKLIKKVGVLSVKKGL